MALYVEVVAVLAMPAVLGGDPDVDANGGDNTDVGLSGKAVLALTALYNTMAPISMTLSLSRSVMTPSVAAYCLNLASSPSISACRSASADLFSSNTEAMKLASSSSRPCLN